MNVSCPSCQAVFRVDPERVPAGGVLTRCALCSETFEIVPEQDASEAATAAVAQPDAAQDSSTERDEPTATPVAEPEEVAEPEPVAQADGEPAAVEAPAHGESGAGEAAETAPEEETETTAPEPEPEPELEPEPVQPVEPVAAPSGAGTPSPFGASDPDAKARRLARALMSDIVMYHPERRDRALQEGTLRREFRDEITKSWEEYVEQVGADRARRTPHFRDALNDILARGQKVF